MPALMRMAGEKVALMRRKGEHAVEDPFTWILTDLLGAFPSVRDRHISEFFSHLYTRKGAYFGRTLGVDAFNLEAVIKHGDDRFLAMGKVARSRDPLPADYFDRKSGEHEQVVDIVMSIRSDSGSVYSANLPNRGQVPNLPAGAVIEGPARAGRKGLAAVMAGPMPAVLASTLASRLQWIELVVEAALERNRDKFIQALFLDGSIDRIDTARRMADELLSANRRFIGTFAAARAGGNRRVVKERNAR